MNLTQLDLCLYPTGTIGEALLWTLRNTCDQVRAVTLKDYQERARWLMRVLGATTQLREVTYESLIALSRERGPRAKDHSPLLHVTIKKRLILLHRALSDAEARGLLPECPKFPNLRNDGESGKRIHTPAQFAAMRARLDEPWQTWVTVGYYTAMRSFDLNRMRWRWFRLEQPFLNAAGEAIAPGQWLRHSHKTDGDDLDTCWMPMEPGLHDWLLGITPRGAPGDPVTPHWWKAVARMAAACEKADVPRISPIDLRRTRASLWLAEGKRDEWIRIAMGHKGYGKPDGSVGRPTIRSVHYFRPTAGLLSGG